MAVKRNLLSGSKEIFISSQHYHMTEAIL